MVVRHRRSVSSAGSSTHLGAAEVGLQFSVLDEDAAPDDFAGLADAFQGAAAEPEIHGGLALADCAFVSADEMLGRRGAGNLEHPDEFAVRTSSP